MKSKQSTLNRFLKRNDRPDSASSSSSSEESVYLPSKEKRKYAAPMSWTRVRDVYKEQHNRMSVFDVEDDLKRNVHKKTVRNLIDNGDLKFSFDPITYDE